MFFSSLRSERLVPIGSGQVSPGIALIIRVQVVFLNF
ncbi:MAG: hypothetical protein QOD74_974 [Variibacter sp.]|jgi:hypothetical protein|nr:hypothetical protein [Variibacter sp.]